MIGTGSQPSPTIHWHDTKDKRKVSITCQVITGESCDIRLSSARSIRLLTHAFMGSVCGNTTTSTSSSMHACSAILGQEILMRGNELSCVIPPSLLLEEQLSGLWTG